MAVVSWSRGYLFLCVPRTASTALAEEVLIPRLDGEWLPSDDVLGDDGSVAVSRKHCTLRDLRRLGLVGAADADDLLVVCGVRNPFDSLVSHWAKMRTQYRKESEARADHWTHTHPAAESMIRDAVELDFSEWLLTRYFGSGSWRHPWSKLVHGRPPPRHLNHAFVVDADVRLRFEHLQDDFDRLTPRLGVDEPIEIPRVNATFHREADYRPYYTPAARAAVERQYAPDLKEFGYRF